MTGVILAFDLGGTNLKYGLGTPEGKILIHSQIKSGGSGALENVVSSFRKAAAEMQSYAEKGGLKITACGVGTPGAVEPQTGKVFGSSPNIPSIVGVSFKSILRDKLNLPVIVDNDGNLATLGEATVGAGKGFSSVMGLTLGTGIGGGFVLKGEIFRGEHGSAMELGHTVIDYKGRTCSCGKSGCIEAYASGTAMVKRANQLGGRRFEKSRPLFAAAEEGSAAALQAVAEGVEALAAGIASLINTLDPGCVVIGGGVMFGFKKHWGDLERMVGERVVDSVSGKTPILPAQLGNNAGIVGACVAAAKGF